MAADGDDRPASSSSKDKRMSQHMEQAEPQAIPADSNERAAEQQPKQTPEEKKPSKLKQLWAKVGLDTLTLMLMFKASLPPTIAIAMYQAHDVSEHFGTIGYLVAITSILAFCIMPRGKFIQNLFINTIAICLAASVNLLALYCAVRARINTTPPGDLNPYNASASAVLAIWLIVQTYLLNVIRAARPQLQFPVIIYSIFVNVSLTYGTLFPDMQTAINFELNLLEAFLTGFALATGVHFVVFPMSSRKVVMKEWTGYVMLMGGMLKAQVAYMNSLSTINPAELREKYAKEDEEAAKARHHHKKHASHHTSLETPEQLKYKEVRNKLIELHTKIEGDITPAKREIAIGKLESHDITQIWNLMRLIFVPIMGLASMINTLEYQADHRGWAEVGGTEEEVQKRNREIDNLHFILKELQKPFSEQVATIEAAFQHILLTLELVKPPKKKQSDVESNTQDPAGPGTLAFAEAYKTKVDNFYASKQKTLRDWCNEHGVELPENFFDPSSPQPDTALAKDEVMRETYQRQLFFTLYLEHLLWRVSTGVLDLVMFVDKRKQEGIFKSSRVIFPGSKTIYKWIQGSVGREDLSNEDSYDMQAGGPQAIYMGEEFGKKRDPEHLPPRNGFEKFGNAIRKIPRFLRSKESVFGIRVVAATMSVGIVCYLSATQTFFLTNRLLWAMIMVSISMTTTAGQSVLNFILRIAGTVGAMLGAYIIWYIVDGKTAGVIVFLWLWIFLAFFVVIKFPKAAIVGILSLVTAILIVGYELQVRVLGMVVATANGQPAYPTYELAPYRLATVVCGLLVAFIWTYFPFPVSESSAIREDLSAAMYLMCSFYGIVHESITIRVLNTGGDPNVKGTHANRLDKARSRAFGQLLRLLNNLKMNSGFSKFQLTIGGRFPRKTYEELIACTQRLTMSTALASFASSAFQKSDDSGEMTKWSSDFRQLLSNLGTASNQVTSLLSLLSSSLSNAQPLPPYLELPEPFQFVKMIENVDRDILSIRHIAEPEYSAFAVLQIVSQNLNNDLSLLLSLVKELVGELDFSFHALKSNSSSSAASSDESADEKGKIA